jgi:hypothetical protein
MKTHRFGEIHAGHVPVLVEYRCGLPQGGGICGAPAAVVLPTVIYGIPGQEPHTGPVDEWEVIEIRWDRLVLWFNERVQMHEPNPGVVNAREEAFESWAAAKIALEAGRIPNGQVTTFELHRHPDAWTRRAVCLKDRHRNLLIASEQVNTDVALWRSERRKIRRVLSTTI